MARKSYRRGRLPVSRRFSLLELLIAMTILSLMLLLLVGFLMSAQNLWRLTASGNALFETSRLTFEVLERDLRSAVVSNEPGRGIGFYVGTPNPASLAGSRVCCLVSSSDPHAEASASLCEIGYGFHTDSTVLNAELAPFTLCRQVVCDNDATNWNFLNRPANWWNNDQLSDDRAAFEKLAGGVAEFTMTFYDRNGLPIAPGTDCLEVPFRIEIYLLLFDEALVSAPLVERFKTQRAFTRVIYLGDLQEN